MVTQKPFLLILGSLVLPHFVLPHGDHGDPSTWKGTCKRGRHQSPVDVEIEDMERMSFPPLKFGNYNKTGPLTQIHEGTSVTMLGFKDWKQRPYVTGGNLLEDKYYLEGMHFHWSSEHTVAHKHFPLELHLVHAKKNVNWKANNFKKSVLVLAILFKIGDKNIEGIEEMLRATATNGKKVPLKTLRPSVFLPEDRATFFSYAGSLTTPPCTEGVLWIVMAQPKIISAAQHKQISRGDVTTHKHLEVRSVPQDP
ncbi:hypothetical protein Q1695_008875 [Nippostrongylus brasiliensis]|nr:hypothetical protein Q1695_008875 [Nippostrongylus brasiliensis]